MVDGKFKLKTKPTIILNIIGMIQLLRLLLPSQRLPLQ